MPTLLCLLNVGAWKLAHVCVNSVQLLNHLLISLFVCLFIRSLVHSNKVYAQGWRRRVREG